MKNEGFRKRWRTVLLTRALSILVLYHLVGIAVGPSPMSYFFSQLKPAYNLYWQTLEFGSMWSFFAPEPGVPPVFLEWEMEDQNGGRTTGQYPEQPSPYWNRERQTLRMAMTGYLMQTSRATERALLPYLCKTRPEAQSVSLWRRMHGVPRLEGFARGEDKLGINTPPVREWVSHSFCEPERERFKRSRS